MLSTPILKNISPFDNTQSEYSFEFYYNGNQCVKNQLVIIKNSDNTEVYNKTIESFQLKHTIPINTLSLNTEYKVKIRVYDVYNNVSEYSDSILFRCYAKAIVAITNIVNGQINNQTFTFNGTYTQEYDVLQSYTYYLYDMDNNLLAYSNEKFDGLLKHEFTGFDNDISYKIELRTMSIHGVESTSGLIPFLCRFIQPKLKSLLTINNKKDEASIDVSAKVIQIIGKLDSGYVSYENGEWINLKNGQISFSEGINLHKNFTMQIWCKDMDIGQTLIKMYDNSLGTVELMYDENRMHLYHKYKTLKYHIASNELNLINASVDTVYICIQYVNGLFTLKANKII